MELGSCGHLVVASGQHGAPMSARTGQRADAETGRYPLLSVKWVFSNKTREKCVFVSMAAIAQP